MPAELPIQVRQTPSTFHPLAQQNAFRHHDVHQQSRSLARARPFPANIQSGWWDLNRRPVAAATALPFGHGAVTSGWWDLNPRPPGPEPGALPS
jgi:hypothetical protein